MLVHSGNTPALHVTDMQGASRSAVHCIAGKNNLSIVRTDYLCKKLELGW